MRLRWIIPLLMLLGLPSAVAHAAEFSRATAPREWEFPRDHGSHPEYATEWWYFTGSVFDGNDHRYGYELTFFRVGLRPDLPQIENRSAWRTRDLIVAHFTVTEVDWQRFHQGEAIQRAAAGLSGARPESLDVWIGDWSARWRSDGSIELHAQHEDFGIDLELRATRPPILHGDNGLSWKNSARSEASYYATQPRMHTSGALTLGGLRRTVTGSTWMDHEFFSGATPREGLGWDWFSLRLSDGRDLMLYRVRRPGEAPTVFGTVVEVDGSQRALDTSDLQMQETRWWSSPHSGTRYPIEWELELPAEQLTMKVEPTLDAQEVVAKRTVGFSYWEGLCDYRVLWSGEELVAEGYVELTGYPTVEVSQP